MTTITDKAAEILAQMPEEAREFLRTGAVPYGAEVMTPQPAKRPYDEPLHPHLGVPYGEWPQYPGATMRDFFAATLNFDPDSFGVAQAEALMGEKQPGFTVDNAAERLAWWLTAEAKYRYARADAMLRERGK